MPSIDELRVDSPDSPDRGQQPGPAPMAGTGSFLDYVLLYLSASEFFAGEVRPLRWSISSPGGPVAVPAMTSIVVYDVLAADAGGDGAAEVDGSPPSGTQIVGCLWSVPSVLVITDFLARLVVTMADGEIRIDEQIIVVKP
jgi:hypothetical protein